ncbi:MAG: hypothetical protein R3C05_06650 [Pirellulaceae bacterium]
MDTVAYEQHLGDVRRSKQQPKVIRLWLIGSKIDHFSLNNNTS